MRSAALACAMFAALSLASVHSPANSQSYPSKPIRFIVPFAPGGTTDILARMVAAKLSTSLGQQVVVDNRAGAGGIIGSEIAARAPGDGYTIAIGHLGTLAVNPSLYVKLPYDPVRDFVAISVLATMPNALVASLRLQVKSFREFYVLAQARPNEFLYGSAGRGSTTHLGIVYLEMLSGMRLRHVPYKGAGPAITDLLAANLSIMIPGLLPVAPHIKSGRLNLLAVSSRKRLPMYPEVPTVDEAGIAGYEYTNWLGVVGPATLPRSIAMRLNAEVANALRQPDLKERLAIEGGEISPSTPDEFAHHIKTEISRWAPIVAAAGARIE